MALAQINPTVGDLVGNLEKSTKVIEQSRRAGVDLVVLPELTTLGYPPRDLLLREDVIQANLDAVQRLAAGCKEVTVIVGCVVRNDSGSGMPLYNSAVVCQGGAVVSRHHKSLLPYYDVFDERRYFEPARSNAPFEFVAPSTGRTHRLGITICEDLWNDEQFLDRRVYQYDPIEHLAAMGADVLVNVSASPYWIGKQEQRFRLFARQAREHAMTLVYVNQVGGNDELLFDGASMVLDSEGNLRASGLAFEEDLVLVDLDDLSAARIADYPSDMDSVLQALVMGVRDYMHKCRFREVVLGLSGGIDSALTAYIASQAIGPSSVHAVALPSRYSTDHSLEDAEQLAHNLGISYRVISIESMHAAAESSLQPHFAGRSQDVTEENIQARIRGQILMALSNKFGWLLLTTGNKSELAVGYSTLYGDMCGGLAVISDVSKSNVYALCRRINEQAGTSIIPERILSKPPSAELKPNQCDQDSLPDYETLDAILDGYIQHHQSPRQLIQAGYDPDVIRDVVRRVDFNEYKRRQAAPGLKVTSRAFGMGRRMPIAARFQHVDSERLRRST